MARFEQFNIRRLFENVASRGLVRIELKHHAESDDFWVPDFLLKNPGGWDPPAKILQQEIGYPFLGIQGVILTDICIFDVVLSHKTMQLDMILMRQR